MGGGGEEGAWRGVDEQERTSAAAASKRKISACLRISSPPRPSLSTALYFTFSNMLSMFLSLSTAIVSVAIRRGETQNFSTFSLLHRGRRGRKG